MKAIFTFLFFLIILLGFFNVIYNAHKTISEIQEWGYLTDSEKRHKIFGDSHEFYSLIKENTLRGDKILLYSTDDKTRFLSIYYLYPRIVKSTKNIKEFETFSNGQKFTYIAAYDIPVLARDYEKIASYSSQTSTHYGSLYKLK